MTLLLLPTSIGDAVDKLTILEIKLERIEDQVKRGNVARELGLVSKELAAAERELCFTDLRGRLKDVNSQLWDVEDSIRDHERRRDFGDDFIRLARSVYRLNDQRAQLKREINLLFGSTLLEEKAYADYDRS